MDKTMICFPRPVFIIREKNPINKPDHNSSLTLKRNKMQRPDRQRFYFDFILTPNETQGGFVPVAATFSKINEAECAH